MEEGGVSLPPLNRRGCRTDWIRVGVSKWPLPPPQTARAARPLAQAGHLQPLLDQYTAQLPRDDRNSLAARNTLRLGPFI